MDRGAADPAVDSEPRLVPSACRPAPCAEAPLRRVRRDRVRSHAQAAHRDDWRHPAVRSWSRAPVEPADGGAAAETKSGLVRMVLASGRAAHARLRAAFGRNPRGEPKRDCAHRDTSRVWWGRYLIHMAKTKDYYDVLGVPRVATQKEITSAFRKLARKHHPDLNAGVKQAEARFKEISEAHDVLYDEFGADWRSAAQAGVQPDGGRRGPGGGFRPQAGGPDVQYRTVSPDEMEDLFGEGGGFGDIFSSIFGNSA